MPYIRESIITTVDRNGNVHIAPIGIIAESDGWVIAPFRPSVTLDNLAVVPFAVANYTDDVRIFAGCLTGRRDWPTVPVDGFPCRASRPRSPTRCSRSKASRMTACGHAISAGWCRKKRMRPSPASIAPRRRCWSLPSWSAG